MARFESNSPYVNIDLNLSNTEIRGDWPNMVLHFDCNFNYYCPTGYASMNYNGINFNTDVYGYTETKTENVNFYITAGQESPRYGANYYNPRMENKRQLSVNLHAWISNGLYTGGGWLTVSSPTVNNPSNLKLAITNITQNSCVVTHSFTNVRNYWFVRLWDRNTRTYFNLNTNNGNGTTTITGLNPNQTYAFELWACGRDGAEYSGSHPSQTITTLGKSSIGNSPTFTIGKDFPITINGYSDSFYHNISFRVGDFQFERLNLKRGDVNIQTTASENDEMYKQLHNVTSKGMDITLETFVNDISIGTNNGTGNVNVDTKESAPSVLSFTYQDVDEDALSITENNQYVLQNISRIRAKDISAQAKKYASLSKYRMQISGNAYESNTTTIQSGIVTKDTQITIEAVDSRGLQGSLTKELALFIPYDVPVIKDFRVWRLNDVDTITKLHVSGTYAQAKIQDIAKNEITKICYRYKKTTETDWSDLTEIIPTIDTNTFVFENRIGNFDDDVSYNFEIQVSDRIRTSVMSSILVVGKPILSIRKGGLGIHKVPEKDRAIDVNGAVHSDVGFYKKGNIVLSAIKDTNGYLGFEPSEVKDWFRTPTDGLMPYKSGGASCVGTNDWPFNAMYAQSYFKNGVAMPNDEETPTIITSSTNGWTAFKFPSGLMLQTRDYRVTLSITNGYGSGYFAYVPPTTNYLVPFTSLYSVHVSEVSNYAIGASLWNPTLTNITGGGNFYVYTLQAVNISVVFQFLAIGRWK